jgi:hypothetical protein
MKITVRSRKDLTDPFGNMSLNATVCNYFPLRMHHCPAVMVATLRDAIYWHAAREGAYIPRKLSPALNASGNLIKVVSTAALSLLVTTSSDI